MTVDDHEIHMALRAILESVAELPPIADRAWSSVSFESSPLRPHVESDYVPGPRPVKTVPVRRGRIFATGLYVVRWFGITNHGEEAIWRGVNAILEAFAAGASQRLGSGNRLLILGDPAPAPSQILPSGKNKSRCTITITWEVEAFNSVPV